MVFCTKGAGGEVCWELREKFVDAIASNKYTINEKDLKVRVGEEPEKLDERRYFWKAVEALRWVQLERVSAGDGVPTSGCVRVTACYAARQKAVTMH